MSLSIIISTWNSIQYLPQCIESIKSLNIPNLELIIIDSGSTDGSEYYATFKSSKRLTWSKANQIGLDICNGDWICLSNPDIVFNDSFKTMFEDCQIHHEILVACPQLIWPDGKRQMPAKIITPELSLRGHTRIGRIISKKHENWQYKYPNSERVEVPYPQGSLFMIHRKVLDHFNGNLWNSGYLNGVSDFDAFLRMKLDGIKIWLYPNIRIIHYGSYTLKKYPLWIERDQAYGLVLYFRYHHLSNKLSPKLYSIIFALESLIAIPFDLIGRIIKRDSYWFNPKLSVWRAGQRILGLIDGWRYKID